MKVFTPFNKLVKPTLIYYSIEDTQEPYYLSPLYYKYYKYITLS